MATDLLRRFTEVARSNPGVPAVMGSDLCLSFSDLDLLSDRAAAIFTRAGDAGILQGEMPYSIDTLPVIGFYHCRSARHVVAAVGAAKAGIPYMPLGCDWPDNRLKAVRGNCRMCLLVCDKEGTSVSGWGGETPVVYTDDLFGAGKVVSSWSRVGMRDVMRARYGDMPPPLYVIHTSGSTGTPKGVALPHDGICANFVGSRGMPGFSAGKRVLYGGALTFDLSIIELWISLLNGCTLVLTPEETLLDAHSLKMHLKKWEINTAAMPVSVMSALAAQDESVFSGLEVLIFGGELPNKGRIEKIMRACPGIVMNNSYGTAETCAVAAAGNISLPLPEGPLAVGKPFGNAELLVVDDDLAPLPAGQVGELLIGGPGVGLGYINDPGRTARCFVIDPRSGKCCYRTGDMAYLQPDGRLVLVGRSDAQFKIGGKRVDPGEISSAVMRQPRVSNVHVAFVRGDYPTTVAYVVADGYAFGMEPGIFAENLRKALAEELPAHLVPGHILVVESIPLTAHGKVDQKRLPVPPAVKPSSSGGDVCAAFQAVLRSEAFSENDAFFDHGGTSLLAAQLIAVFRSVFQVAVPFRLFSHPRTAYMVRLFIENARMNGPAAAGSDAGARLLPVRGTGVKAQDELTVKI